MFTSQPGVTGCKAAPGTSKHLQPGVRVGCFLSIWGLSLNGYNTGPCIMLQILPCGEQLFGLAPLQASSICPCHGRVGDQQALGNLIPNLSGLPCFLVWIPRFHVRSPGQMLEALVKYPYTNVSHPSTRTLYNPYKIPLTGSVEHHPVQKQGFCLCLLESC